MGILVRSTFIIAAFALSACGASNGAPFQPAPALHKAQTRTSSSFRVLHSFQGGTDGAIPFAGLTYNKGTLYGTTADFSGTVFSVGTAGNERVLYAFKAKGDGHEPRANLLVLDGTLYGTTSTGGTYGDGTAFAVTSSGKERVLHSFDGLDGRNPYGPLIEVNSMLYGTTRDGGTANQGTLFTMTPSGSENVLYNFEGPGAHPLDGLVDAHGSLCGTTSGSHAHNLGSIFCITTEGVKATLHRFGGPPGDGQHPLAGLTDLHGTLYGTTPDGGTHGNGTVFAITRSGSYSVLYNFGETSADGAWPNSRLIDVKGTLYGTTQLGGTHRAGTIFAIAPSGNERVLYSLPGGRTGANDPQGITYVDGILYGTTSAGGAQDRGTVFDLTL